MTPTLLWESKITFHNWDAFGTNKVIISDSIYCNVYRDPRVFSSNFSRRFAANFLFRKEKFQEEPLGPGYIKSLTWWVSRCASRNRVLFYFVLSYRKSESSIQALQP